MREMNLTNRLIWFLQISDLHLSIFHHPERITEFKEFCELTLTTIKPAAVLASGDLTDSKTKNGFEGNQLEEEWLKYHEVLTNANVSNKTKWLDIRGNHDSFDVSNLNSSSNFFRKYSEQGLSHPRSYKHIITNEAGMSLHFIAVDASLDPGPKLPFNFIGNLDDNEMDRLKSFADNSDGPIVWFGHFPTSSIFNAGSNNIKSVIAKNPLSIVYLCGHFHMSRMYTIHDEGFAELELGDWKSKRIFRLLAFDQGLFTFTDVRHGDWPIILITNPKIPWLTIRNNIETKEDREANMKYIRILAFSLGSIKHVSVQIDEEREWRNCSNDQGSPHLYITEWDTKMYSNGLHTIKVRVEDDKRQIREINQQFALDGSKPALKLFPQLMLRYNFIDTYFMIFVIASLVNLVPLIIYRFISKYTKYKINYDLKLSLIKRHTRRMISLSSVNRIFYPLLLFYIYLCIGPWAVGELITGYWGWIFSWGIYLNGKIFKDIFVLIYGFSEISFFHLPLKCILSYQFDKRMQTTLPNIQNGIVTSSFFYADIIFFALMIFHVLCYLLLLIISGWVYYIIIFIPLKIFSIFFAFWLWNEARRTISLTNHQSVTDNESDHAEVEFISRNYNDTTQ